MKLSDWMPFVMSAFFCMGISPVLIPYLHRLKFDQTIREDGPTWHNAKGKTPTMGGIAFVASTTIGVLPVPPTARLPTQIVGICGSYLGRTCSSKSICLNAIAPPYMAANGAARQRHLFIISLNLYRLHEHQYSRFFSQDF